MATTPSYLKSMVGTLLQIKVDHVYTFRKNQIIYDKQNSVQDISTPKPQTWEDYWHQKEVEIDQSREELTWGEYWRRKEVEKQRFLGNQSKI
jgi:hypothetical protein